MAARARRRDPGLAPAPGGGAPTRIAPRTKLSAGSYISLFHLLGAILGSPHRSPQNRHGGILPAAGNEAGAVHHKQVLDIVALVPLIQDAGLGIVSHAASAHLVDAVARGIVLVRLGDGFPARSMEQFLDGIRRVFRDR